MLKQALIFVHRWLGVVLCLLFLLWFPSGFVMMYWDYPSITAAQRLAHTAPLNPASIKLSAAEAAAKAQALLNYQITLDECRKMLVEAGWTPPAPNEATVD